LKRLIRALEKRGARFLSNAMTRAGVSRFYTNRLFSYPDLDVAYDVLSTEFFRNEMTPTALPLEPEAHYVAIAPHQDDEAIGAGGTLLLAHRQGAKTSVVFVTDGQQENLSEGSDNSIAVRRAEARSVCDLFGAGMYELGVSNVSCEITVEHVERFAEIVRTLGPDVLLTPWILDAPPKHRMTCHLLYLACHLATLPDFDIWGYQVHNILPPNGYVDITQVAGEKREAIALYKSQLERFAPYDHLALAMNGWNQRYLRTQTEPQMHKYIETFFVLTKEEWTALFSRTIQPNLDSYYGADKQLGKQMCELHQQIA